ncbi:MULTISPECIES: LysE family transporter [Dokdonia]|jgi:threonine/homoserine/homoserine lactone efflux protein|uniref:Lysine transporter LysE n=2 Tax=Dokdonia TaxID=326319 RepID=A0A0A2GWM7_9FLAO|nr:MULTISPECIES: LysE family transporter [Dokdonia]ANH59544.1 LysE type translocator [Dokdonia donghaensis DSW-1]AOE09050.1 lysine transporter LysE [uncultured bacterium]EAQ39664.1 LysE type translocator [Dokdonia sp. MED134]KGO06918.1 lysine transporter LysE [Dokdonia donghaensis DSW-1]
MFEDLHTAIPLGFFLAFLIGPVFFVLLETAATKGFRAALSFDIGVIIADIIFIMVAYLSSYQLLENLSNQPGLYVFGGAILIVYGLTIYLKKPTRDALDPNRAKVKKGGYLQLFIKGFLLNFINIGVLVFWLGILIIIGPTVENDGERLLGFFIGMIGAYFITDLGKIILAKQLKRYLTPRRIFKLKKVLGLVLIVCGLVLVTKGFVPSDEFNIQQEMERFQEIPEITPDSIT